MTVPSPFLVRMWPHPVPVSGTKRQCIRTQSLPSENMIKSNDLFYDHSEFSHHLYYLIQSVSERITLLSEPASMSILSILPVQPTQADATTAPKRPSPQKHSLYKRKANDPQRLLQALASLCFVLALIPILDMITLAAAESLSLPRLPTPPSPPTLGDNPSLRTDLGAHFDPAKEVFGRHEPPPELARASDGVMKVLLGIALASAGLVCLTFPRWGRRWNWAKALFVDEGEHSYRFLSCRQRKGG